MFQNPKRQDLQLQVLPSITPISITRFTSVGYPLLPLLYLLQDLQQQVLRSLLQLLDLQQQVLPSYNSYIYNKIYNSRSFAATTPIPTTRPTTAGSSLPPTALRPTPAGPSLPPTTLRPTTAGSSLLQLLYLLQDLQQQVLPSHNSYTYDKAYNSRFFHPIHPNLRKDLQQQVTPSCNSHL